MTITWPEGFDPNDYWPSPGTTTLQSDRRTFRHFRYKVYVDDIRADLCVEVRTVESTAAELLGYHKQTGKRPSERSHSHIDAWLRRYHASSIRKMCNDLGIPGGRNLLSEMRTIESVRQELLEYYDRTGKRPSQRELPSADSWLRTKGSSVCALCEELKIPGKRNNYTLEGVTVELTAHYQKTGVRPTARSHKRLDEWLRHHRSSVYKLCNELGIR